MERNLAFELPKLNSSDEATRKDAEPKVKKLRDAITGWTKITEHVDATLAKAAEGTLPAVEKLMSEQLLDEVRKLDQSAAREAKARLETYNALIFSGGGHAVRSLLIMQRASVALT